MVKDGSIRDGKTIMLLQHVQQLSALSGRGHSFGPPDARLLRYHLHSEILGTVFLDVDLDEATAAVAFPLRCRVKADPLQKSFSDWQVTCSNAGFCIARNIPGDKGLVMTIARHAGVNDRPLLRIDYGSAYSSEVPGGPLQDNLLLDHHRLRPDLKHWTVEPHHLTTSNATAIDEFLGQIPQCGRHPNHLITRRPLSRCTA